MFTVHIDQLEYEQGSFGCVSPSPDDIGHFVIKRMVIGNPTEECFATQVLAQVVNVEFIDENSPRIVSVIELSPDGIGVTSEKEQRLVLGEDGIVTNPGAGYLIGNSELPENELYLTAEELLAPVRNVPLENKPQQFLTIDPSEQF